MLTIDSLKIKPFPHQAECLAAIEGAEKNGAFAGLVIMASGLGKTIVSALEFKRRLVRNSNARGLFLCHQNDILEQAQVEYEKVFGSSIQYGFFNGDEKTHIDCTILFASFQAMRENLHLFESCEFDYIVVDETHHSKAPTYEPVVLYFKPAFLLGITAMVERMDGLDIREIYGQEIYSLPLIEALVRGLLCPVEYKLMTDEISSLKNLTTEKGKLSIKFLNRTVFVPKRDEEIARIIQSEMDKIENPLGIFFVPSIEHAELLAEMIPHSVPIHSKVRPKERKVRLELFRQGVFKAAICVDVLNEGIDIPEANLIVFLRMTGSPTVYFEQFGRGLRLHKSKSKVVVLDFVVNCERIMKVMELWTKIKTAREVFVAKQNNEKVTGSIVKEVLEPFIMDVESIEFQERVIPIVEAIRKIRADFYGTWQEASEAVKRLGIKNGTDYAEKYRQDPQLVSIPSKYYEDFPGWGPFTGVKENIRFASQVYPTWQEASIAAIALGVTSSDSYDKLYLKDFRLCSRPHKVYADFPGWGEFLGTGKEMRTKETVYADVNDAMAAAQKLNVTDCKNYKKRYKSDPKLPSSPDRFYGESFPGWGIFLGTGNQSFKRKDKGELYKTWDEAAVAIKALNILSAKEYKKRHAEDNMLPRNLWIVYQDFPGWMKFFHGEDYMEAPDDWFTNYQLSPVCRVKPNTIARFAEQFRSENSDWFKNLVSKSNKYVEHYHPDLVEKIKAHFTKK